MGTIEMLSYVGLLIRQSPQEVFKSPSIRKLQADLHKIQASKIQSRALRAHSVHT